MGYAAQRNYKQITMNGKPLVGISACLLGEKVRYDGGDKLDHYLRDVLGKTVDFIAICPEAESGMGVPREPMRLVHTGVTIRMLTQNTKRDMTSQMEPWLRKKLAELAGLPLCGYIFKARSPSCGLREVPCHPLDGGAVTVATGLFAQALTESLPVLPVVDEESLRDTKTRDKFIEQVFSMQRQLGA